MTTRSRIATATAFDRSCDMLIFSRSRFGSKWCDETRATGSPISSGSTSTSCQLRWSPTALAIASLAAHRPATFAGVVQNSISTGVKILSKKRGWRIAASMRAISTMSMPSPTTMDWSMEGSEGRGLGETADVADVRGFARRARIILTEPLKGPAREARELSLLELIMEETQDTC